MSLLKWSRLTILNPKNIISNPYVYCSESMHLNKYHKSCWVMFFCKSFIQYANKPYKKLQLMPFGTLIKKPRLLVAIPYKINATINKYCILMCYSYCKSFNLYSNCVQSCTQRIQTMFRESNFLQRRKKMLLSGTLTKWNK